MKNIVQLILIIIFYCFSSSVVKAQQDSTKKNTLYLELGGNNYYYSINYERDLFFNFSPRFGASIVPKGESSHTYGTYLTVNFNVLFMINYSFHLSQNHMVECGFGYADILDRERVHATLSLDYKFIPNNSKMVFKASLTPIFNKDVVKDQIWFGFGIGFIY